MKRQHITLLGVLVVVGLAVAAAWWWSARTRTPGTEIPAPSGGAQVVGGGGIADATATGAETSSTPTNALSVGATRLRGVGAQATAGAAGFGSPLRAANAVGPDASTPYRAIPAGMDLPAGGGYTLWQNSVPKYRVQPV
jgi:hypothetical protein